MGMQDALVGVVAIGVAALLVRRLVRAMRPSVDAACPKCASGVSPCADVRQPPALRQAR